MGCAIAYLFGTVFLLLAILCFLSPLILKDDSQPAPPNEGMMTALQVSVGFLFFVAAMGLFSC